jgi:DNA modification methylase
MERRRHRDENGFEVSRDLTPRLVPEAECKPLGRETRKHPPKQVRKLAASLRRYDFVYPILIDADGRVVDGWALVLATRHLGLNEVPAVTVTDLSEAELRVLRLALNRITQDAEWDQEALSLEFSETLELDPRIEVEFTGFEGGEVEALLPGNDLDQEDDVPPINPGRLPVSRAGDVWNAGEHRVGCANALEAESFDRVLGGDKAEMMITDPPYHVRVEGHVSGLGAVKHHNFAMAPGELTAAEFKEFLKTSCGHAARRSVDGAIHFVCMDWRHQCELIAAGLEVYSKLMNMCIWNKSNAGMGSLYRSKHELIFVFKVGTNPHINNVALGRYGRHRTNVWDYPSQNTFSRTKKSKLALHPTVKPVAMIADAIRDCSNRGGLILDPFGGAGTTLIAAEHTGRRARVLELDPIFVDVTIERWQRLTGGTAVHAETGEPFTRPGTTDRRS